MSDFLENEGASFLVVTSDDGQYLIWPVCREVPASWSVELAGATRQACLEFIQANWFDMRPISIVDAQVRSVEKSRGQRFVQS